MNDFKQYSELFHSRAVIQPSKHISTKMNQDFTLATMVKTLDDSDIISKRDYDTFEKIMKNHRSETDLASGKDAFTDGEREMLKTILSHYKSYIGSNGRKL